tara:strand:- start:333 stop:773 length:441 start_codon:yes stop_codon:yes gene_type:complete
MIDLQVLDDYAINICETQELTLEQLKSKSRKRKYVEKRMVLSYILRVELGMTYQAIGDYLGLNHATILHHCRKCKGFLDVYPHFRRIHEDFMQILELHKGTLYESINPKNINVERSSTRAYALIKTLLNSNRILRIKIELLKEQNK